MIATILRQAPADRRASIAAWRQLSDILAQRGNQLDDDDIRRSLHALAVLRPQVPESVRRDSARALARHGRFAPLVAFYANDVPAVSAIMLRDTRLSEADWLALLPATNAMARSVLAGRGDLPDGVYRALASLGSASVALPHPEVADVVEDAPEGTVTDEVELVAETGPSQISELVRRIDKYQSSRSQPPAQRPPRAAFLFETGPDGVIHWVEGVTRGAVIGLSIAEAAFGGEPGTDGVAAGAFRQRAEIINARMILEGTAADAGEWRFSALPWFDPATGQFRGYRASARRPYRNETPYGRQTPEDSGDSIRQLIHELRSPLNAISGFAQIISGQMFGPVSQDYRAMAETIVADAASVQSIIDDLETAARSNAAPADLTSNSAVDVGAIVAQVESDLGGLLAERRIDLSISRVGGPFVAVTDDANARRMVGRMLTALVDISEPGAILVGQLVTESPHDDMLQLRIVRPAPIRFATAAELLDPGFSPDGEAPGAAVLSLGFSLRLVDSLARAAGGRLDIGHNALTLHVPSANSKAEVGLEVQQGE
ncbi:histidine kinase [Sphingopyxis sp. H115]|nr:histidine kinase [Sphingopyxis sp. H115]